MTCERFPARLRIKHRREFLYVQRRGQKHHVGHFLVFVAPIRCATVSSDVTSSKALPESRLGITVTRKIGHAVARNRIKRLVREVFRRHRSRVAPGLDMVWVAKRQAAEVAYEEVVLDMERLLGRRGLSRVDGDGDTGSCSA